jgi:hypothetical protein
MLQTTEQTRGNLEMARSKAKSDRPIGPTLAKNLLRLGHADIVVRATDLAEKVRAKTGKPMTRQRISMLMNAVRVEDETIATLAKAIGVKPDELTKD